MAANSNHSNKETNLQDDLLSFETLDRASPDLWPEQIPGVSTFAADKSPSSNTNPPKWMADLENDDINSLQEFGSLTTSQLMDKVKGLQNLAYQLGLDEGAKFGSFLDGEVSMMDRLDRKICPECHCLMSQGLTGE